MKAYSLDELYGELAFVAYYLHWPHAEVVALEHAERRRWCQEISRLHRAMNGAKENPFDV